MNVIAAKPRCRSCNFVDLHENGSTIACPWVGRPRGTSVDGSRSLIARDGLRLLLVFWLTAGPPLKYFCKIFTESSQYMNGITLSGLSK